VLTRVGQARVEAASIKQTESNWVDLSISTLFPMAQITLDLLEDLAQALSQQGERLPALLTQALTQPALPAHIYRHILAFLTSHPSPEAIANFHPTPEMMVRLPALLEQSRAGTLSEAGTQELEEFERIEHLIVMLKASNLDYLKSAV
jgi:hypothetical protein